jgi:hypothetical protein
MFSNGLARTLIVHFDRGELRELTMHSSIKRGMSVCLLGSVLATSGCNTDGTAGVKFWDPHAQPDWAVSSIDKDKPLARAGSISEIIDSSGRCMADSFSAVKDPAADQGKAVHKPLAPTAIALDMSECEIVKRAGPADRINISVDERGERAATLTYADAVRPGLYRFRSGRLFSIERLPEPSAQTKKTGTAKRTEGKSRDAGERS